jgi:PEP-CTERM motif
MKRSLLVLTALALLGTAQVQATTIVQDTSGSTSSRFQFFWGQSFTTPTGGPWSSVTFNFYDLTLAPYAAGTGYLFTAAYAGTPANLASAGAVAVSAPADGAVYSFGPGFRLQPGTQYFFYEDAPMRLLGGGTDAIGGTSVFTQNGTGTFVSAGGQNANFKVSGTVAAVPEPAGWAMLVVGFGSLGVMARRRRRSVERCRGTA